ncbi:MAG: lactate racemase domain-containing protein [Candidatus Dormibacteraceae bacterium]
MSVMAGTTPNSIDFGGALPALARLTRDLYGDQAAPRVALIRQRVDAPRLADIEAAVVAAVARVAAATGRRGPIAVGVGSRGIANIAAIVITTVRELRRAGFQPFIVPAMGSHGSSDATGQAQILADYGIDEETTGVPVRATMDTVVMGEVDGVPVQTDRFVAETGAVFLVSRVKPHTDFEGPIESGLAKMAAIGLGKQRGAQLIHSAGVRGLRELVPLAARLLAARGVLLGGIAIVENARDETAEIHGVLGSEVAADFEAEILSRAKDLMPRIPFDSLHVLVLDRMGKDVSGAGMDTNVLGRWRIPGVEENARPQIACIVPLTLTPASHGNAAGLGLAEFVPLALAESVDLAAFYANSLTAGIVGLERGQFPIVLPTDRDCILAAAGAAGRVASSPLRLAWIQDTLHTETFAVSEDLLPEVRERDDLEQLGEPVAMPFDAGGRLRPIAELIGD